MPQVSQELPPGVVGIFFSADGVAMPVWAKDPYDVEDFTLDFSLQLAPNDTIAAANFVVDPGAELTVLSSNFTTTTATCWLQGGVLLETYSVACQITTADGRQEERTFQVVLGTN